ncbi:DENN (AEX-3) domain-containing protein [Zea mays]|uniref:DENN (AEX-3) domain-containing protein n=1 Tax=Zea mays TaxID=4577 RepID=A0A1D6PJR9_MAIZE|nr:DENN (AEX-3) domain-containing protein [Zea mays]
MEEEELTSGGGDAALLAPEPREQAAEEGRSPRDAEAFEDAVEEASAASTSPVACCNGDAAETSSPPAWKSQVDGPSAPEEAETYESPSASSSGCAAMEVESSLVSELREEPGRVDAGSAASPSGQRAGGTEEHENSMATPGAGSPSREETDSCMHSAPSSPPRSASSTSSPPRSASLTSSPPLPQIKQQSRHVRTGSFQRFREQMQRAWKWGPIGGGGGGERSPREQLLRTTVNIEAMANQKRHWYQVRSKSQDNWQYREPTSLFEHFFVVGLHSYADVGVVEDAFAKKKAWESNVARSEIVNLRKNQYRGPVPSMEPQILFKYPPGKRAEVREADLPSFCFPEGVKARLIERTPSMSDLNEVIFGQEHLSRDDLSFIFSLKVSDNAPLYGVCLHVQEIVQKAPGILGAVSPLNPTSYKPSRFLVSAPRCYCLLTKVPFFELHYEMLNSIIAQERLDRITQFASEITLAEPVPRPIKEQDGVDGDFDSSNGIPYIDWTEYAVPVNSISGLISSSSIPSERDMSSYLFRSWEPNSSQSISGSEISDSSYVREVEEARHSFQHYEDCIVENLEPRCDSFGRASYMYDNGHTSPDLLSMHSPASSRLERAQSVESLESSVKGATSDEEYEVNVKHEVIVDDEKVVGWAKAHNNEPLQIVCGYHALHLPPRGGELVFRPLEHLQPVKYSRPGLPLLGFGEEILDNALTRAEKNKINLHLVAAEEALALSIWTMATVCRSLSLESVLGLFTGVLLEKQIVVICPNLGVLSAILLSIIPMIRPFQWQSLLLPAGVQHKPPDIKMKGSSLVRVNVQKDQAKHNCYLFFALSSLDCTANLFFYVKACSLPRLPHYKELVSNLGPLHARLSCENSLAKRHPIYKCNEVQADVAWKFLNIMRTYLESLCSDLRFHTITNVQSNNDRVSLLLKDSFIDSFPSNDRPFIKISGLSVWATRKVSIDKQILIDRVFLDGTHMMLSRYASLWRRRCFLFYQILDCPVSKMNGHKGIVPVEIKHSDTLCFGFGVCFLVLPLHVISNAQGIGKIKTRHVAWSAEDFDFAEATSLIRSVLKSI